MAFKRIRDYDTATLPLAGTELFEVETAAGASLKTTAQAIANLAPPTPAEPPAINTQTASYTVVLADAGKWIDMNVATANTLTIPPNSAAAFPIGTEIHARNMGAGLTTLTAGAGVTIRKPASQTLTLKEQWSVASIKKIGVDEWTAFGHLT